MLFPDPRAYFTQVPGADQYIVFPLGMLAIPWNEKDCDTQLRTATQAAVKRDWKKGHGGRWPWEPEEYAGMVVAYPRIDGFAMKPCMEADRLAVEIELGHAVEIMLEVFRLHPCVRCAGLLGCLCVDVDTTGRRHVVGR